MATERALVRQALFDRLEQDDSFYHYYDDLNDDEIQAIADERANTYINEAIINLKRKCEPDITFALSTVTDADEFTEDLTAEEILLIGGDLAFEAYIARGIAKLKAFEHYFAPSDMKTFSTANERKTFMDMYATICAENKVKISDYAARDRLTGKFKSVNTEGVGYDT